MSRRAWLMALWVSLGPQCLSTLDGELEGQTTKTNTRPAAAKATAREKPSHFENAERLLKEGQFQEAIEEYRISLEDYPENEAAYFGMALAQVQAGLPQDAVQSYQAAIKINPDLWEAEANLGMLLLNKADFEGALPHLQRARQLKANSFQISFFCAKALESLNRLQDSAAVYLEALSMAKTSSEKLNTHLALGQIYVRLRSWDQAEEQLIAARRDQEDSLELDLEIARLYLESGQTGKCVEFLQPLTARSPGNADLQELFGKAQAKAGSLEQAASALERALAIQTDPARRQTLTFELASVLQRLGEPAKAMQLLEPIAEGSQDSKLHFHLGTLRLQIRDFQAASQSFSRALQLDPSCIDCYSNLGSVFMLQEKYVEAIHALSRFKVARPEVAGTYFYLGIAFDKLNDFENAYNHYRQFLSIDQGKSDKQTFQARERMKVLEKRIKKR
jgi:tetratricopeptide (TPR) repeat protein